MNSKQEGIVNSEEGCIVNSEEECIVNSEEECIVDSKEECIVNSKMQRKLSLQTRSAGQLLPDRLLPSNTIERPDV